MAIDDEVKFFLGRKLKSLFTIFVEYGTHGSRLLAPFVGVDSVHNTGLSLLLSTSVWVPLSREIRLTSGLTSKFTGEWTQDPGWQSEILLAVPTSYTQCQEVVRQTDSYFCLSTGLRSLWKSLVFTHLSTLRLFLKSSLALMFNCREDSNAG